MQVPHIVTTRLLWTSGEHITHLHPSTKQDDQVQRKTKSNEIFENLGMNIKCATSWCTRGNLVLNYFFFPPLWSMFHNFFCSFSLTLNPHFLILLFSFIKEHPTLKPSKAFSLKKAILVFVSGGVLCIFLLGCLHQTPTATKTLHECLQVPSSQGRSYPTTSGSMQPTNFSRPGGQRKSNLPVSEGSK